MAACFRNALPACLVLLLIGTASPIVIAQDTTKFPSLGKVVRIDPALERLLAPEASIEVLAGGFVWSEGPVWVPREGGFLLFSDIPRNRVMKWVDGEGVSVFMEPSGFTGVTDYSGEPGSNGLGLDPEGNLTLCEHGDRRLSRMTWNGGKQTIVDSYQGKRFNSPNDHVWSSSGDLYFTDPPYGLRGRWESTQRELDFCGVFQLRKNGLLTLVDKMNSPNGIGVSPDGRTLYVAQSGRIDPGWSKYAIDTDGSVGTRELFFDARTIADFGPGSADGMAIDIQGNIWATGPGGVLIFTPQAKLLGRIAVGERVANCCFGGSDGSTLYMTADMWLCRIQTKTRGLGL